MSKDEPLLSNCPLETAEPSRNYARVPGYKKKYKKKTRKGREKKRKMNGVEINTHAYVATRLLLRWDYLYAVTLKSKVFEDYNHARLEVSWITSTRGLLLRGYTGRVERDLECVSMPTLTNAGRPSCRRALCLASGLEERKLGSSLARGLEERCLEAAWRVVSKGDTW